MREWSGPGHQVVNRSRCPVPPWPHQRRRTRPGPGEERVRPRGPPPGAAARPAPTADRGRSCRRSSAAHPPRSRRPALDHPGGSGWIPARARDHPRLGQAAGSLQARLGSGCREPAGRYCRGRPGPLPGKQANPGLRSSRYRKEVKRTPAARRWRKPAPGDNPICQKTGSYAELNPASG